MQKVMLEFTFDTLEKAMSFAQSIESSVQWDLDGMEKRRTVDGSSYTVYTSELPEATAMIAAMKAGITKEEFLAAANPKCVHGVAFDMPCPSCEIDQVRLNPAGDN